MQGASDTNSWYDCYRGLRNKLNLEGTEMGEITLVTDFFDIGRGQDKNEELRRTAVSGCNGAESAGVQQVACIDT